MEDRVKTTIIVEGLPNDSSFYTFRKVISSHDKLWNNIIPKNEYTPAKDDKIYFYPDCNVPRFKVKQFCEKYGASIVKYSDKASVKIAGENTLKSFIENKTLKEISKEDFVKYLQKFTTADVTEIIEKVDSENIYMFYTDTKYENTYGAKLKTHYSSKPFVKQDCEEKFMSLLNDTNSYDEKEILKRLNTGAVMDEEQYVSIQRLFESKDVENHKLAIEMMANCDFEKSSVYLLLLIHKFGYRIYDAPNRTHVNFKSLLKFFDLKDVRSNQLDDVMGSLIKRKLLSAHNLNVMIPLIKKELDRGSISDYVKIKSVEVTEDVLKALEENILDINHNTTVVEYDSEELNPHI